MLVFVYGTLKRGSGNNHILSSSRFVCEGVVRGMELYMYGFPVANRVESGTVIGEVWDIGDDTSVLSRLDSLEGYPGSGHSERNMYNREEVSVFTDSGTLQCSMYVGGSGSWRNFERMTLCPINENGHYEWQSAHRRLDVA